MPRAPAGAEYAALITRSVCVRSRFAYSTRYAYKLLAVQRFASIARAPNSHGGCTVYGTTRPSTAHSPGFQAWAKMSSFTRASRGTALWTCLDLTTPRAALGTSV